MESVALLVCRVGQHISGVDKGNGRVSMDFNAIDGQKRGCLRGHPVHAILSTNPGIFCKRRPQSR
ncbi:hypothetical protein MSKU15_0421 [Komagataeibacter diospyri]|nr:hypothetical protein MSKU15_0421 [Komagataeibacter diospyri]